MVQQLAVVACVLLIATRAAWAVRDVKLKFARERWCNPSLVQYQDSFISAAKATEFQRIGETTWWINSLYMCEGSKADMHSLACKPYSPWVSKYVECKFDKRVRNGHLDVSGLGDVKVWTWPGKGVYAVFGRKPQRTATSATCDGLIVYHQWLAQVRTDPALAANDPWNLAGRDPLALLPSPQGHSYPDETSYVMEKNWMPFVYRDPATNQEQLFVTYMVVPHMVYQLAPDGTATHRWTTSDARVFERFHAFDVHGGPPMVYVPAERSGDGTPYYLGVMHHIERFDKGRIRLYRHFLFRTSAHPPFPVTAISDELPLVFNQTYKVRTAWVAFVSGLFLDDTGQLLITYGSADIESRVLSLSVQEFEGLFTGTSRFRDVKVPYEPYDKHAAEHAHPVQPPTRASSTSASSASSPPPAAPSRVAAASASAPAADTPQSYSRVPVQGAAAPGVGRVIASRRLQAGSRSGGCSGSQSGRSAGSWEAAVTLREVSGGSQVLHFAPNSTYIQQRLRQLYADMAEEEWAL